MKQTLITLLGLLFLTAGYSQNAPKAYSIKGTFDKSIQADSIFIYSDNGIIASAPVVNGTFELRGSIREPERVDLITRVKGEDPEGGSKVGRPILENADYTFVYKDKNSKIKGGKLHDMVLGFESSDEFQKAVDEFHDVSDAVFKNKEIDDELTADENKQIQAKMDNVLGIEYRELASVIESAESPVLAKAFALARIQDWDAYPMEKRLTLLDTYDKAAKEGHEAIHKLRKVYVAMKEAEDVQKTVAVGYLIKEIEAKDTEGKTIKLSEIVAQNKYTILEFWASWCSPCRAEIPNLKRAYEKYKAKGLEIYSISLDENQDKWLKALTEENTTWINVVENLGFKGKAIQDYGVMGVPASFLINQEGKIVAISEELRGSDLDKTLSKYIK